MLATMMGDEENGPAWMMEFFSWAEELLKLRAMFWLTLMALRATREMLALWPVVGRLGTDPLGWLLKNPHANRTGEPSNQSRAAETRTWHYAG